VCPGSFVIELKEADLVQAGSSNGSPSRRVLVVGPSWIGDMVMAQSLFMVIKKLEPAVAIDVLAPAWSRPILDRMPEVRQTLDMPVGHGRLELLTRVRLGRRLKAEAYDQAIVLPNSFKSALVPLFAGIPRRTGWRGEMRYGLLNDLRLLDKKNSPIMVERYAFLGYPPGEATREPAPWPSLKVDQAALPALLARLGLSGERPVLALCPGAEFGPTKRWPERYYAEVAETMIGRGWRVWLMGSARDQPVTQAVAGGLSQGARAECRDLAGETELGEAIDLLSTAGAVVANDSGLMHISAALARPLVAIYGATGPAFAPPLTSRAASLSVPVDCGPCYRKTCSQGGIKCLTDITPGQVLDALQELASA